jgi:hypothetical protein
MLRCIEAQSSEAAPVQVLLSVLRNYELRSQGITFVHDAGVIVKKSRFCSHRLSCGKLGYIVQKLWLRARVSTRGARAALDVRRTGRTPLR